MLEINILEELFDDKILKILKLFMRDHGNEFYLQEISTKTGVSLATTFRIVKKLLQLSLIKEHKVKKFRLYRLDDNDNTKFLKRFLREETRILDIFVRQVSKFDAIKLIILHGEETKSRANVLIIGEDFETNEIKKICAELKEKYDFVITTLPLRREQFEQISKMGLYPGRKRILFERK